MRLCRCGKRLLEDQNLGTCVWCGYGDVQLPPAKNGHRPRLRALPRDLGSLQREGRRPLEICENVVSPWALRLIRSMPFPLDVEEEQAA